MPETAVVSTTPYENPRVTRRSGNSVPVLLGQTLTAGVHGALITVGNNS